jgi:hypothetical protein
LVYVFYSVENNDLVYVFYSVVMVLLSFDWLIDYCLMPSGQYLCYWYIQDENKLNNI